MPVSAETLRKLIAAGLSGEALLDVVASIDADGNVSPKIRSAHAIRQERYRARQASQSVTSDASLDAHLPSEGSSPTPLSPNHPTIPPSPPKGGSSPVGFEDFWAIYPHRVGKADASKAFSRARSRAPLDAIMAGLRRYVAKTDDRPWCNPATFLNQDRWTDQPATVVPMARGSPAKPRSTADALNDLGREMRHAEPGGSDWDDAGGFPRIGLAR